ncbi:MAG TPA: DUF2802 domain-containing protein [Steroidobacteraceae bacterium]|nr:DUF2802 domain-containing protein [Steroidobacteraceae bacterium]
MASVASLPLEDFLLAGRAAFLVFSFMLAAFAFTRWRRAAERDTAHVDERLGSALARLATLEATVAQIEPSLRALGEQIETHFKAATVGTAPNSYPIAIRLARAGAQPQEIVASCGLSRQEAELVARLHGRAGEGYGPARSGRGHSAAA